MRRYPPFSRRRSVLPPGPTDSPSLQSSEFAHHPYELFDRYRARYGDVFTLRMVGLPEMVVVGDPTLAQDVLARPSEFLGGAGNRATKVNVALGDHFLMSLDGEAHERLQRRLLAIMATARGRLMTDVRTLTRARMDSWPRDASFSLELEMQRLALDIILTVLLGADREPMRRRLGDLVHRMVGTSLLDGTPNMLRSSLGFFPLREDVHALIDEEIDHRRREGRGERIDVLSTLLEPHDGEEAMTREEIRDQVLSMTVAGYDTTATTLTWALLHLLDDPAVAAAVAPDVARIAALAEPTAAELLSATRLNDLVNETARLFPVSPIVNRMTRVETRLGPWSLPPGIMVCPCLYLLHRHESFGDDADRFRLDRRPTQNRACFLPFGGGERRCIGQGFARPEMNLVLATILSSLRLEAVGAQPKGVRRGFVVIPDTGLPVRILGRASVAV